MNDAVLEAMAKLKAARLAKVKTATERAIVTGSGSPETDYLLEMGYVTAGSPNARHRWSPTSLFLTKAGKAWVHANGGVHHAATVYATHMRPVQEAA